MYNQHGCVIGLVFILALLGNAQVHSEVTDHVVKKPDQFFGKLISSTEEKYLLGPGDYVVTNMGTENKKVRSGTRFNIYQRNTYVPKDRHGRAFYEWIGVIRIVKSFPERSIARIVHTRKELNFLTDQVFYLDPVQPPEEKESVPPVMKIKKASPPKTIPPSEPVPAAPVAKKKLVFEKTPPVSPKERFEGEAIHFAFDDAGLTEDSIAVLKRKIAYLKAHPDARVRIEGHCDERGSVEYNLGLGQRRADKAKAFLTKAGIPADRISTVSYGKERPIDPRHTEEAWAKNRRCEFRLVAPSAGK